MSELSDRLREASKVCYMEDVGFLITREELVEAADEIERLRAALEPFANYYDLNDCTPRDSRLNLEVPITDLLGAKRALR